METALKSSLNDAAVTGFYTTATQGLDFNIDLKRLDARTIEAFSFGQLQQGKGQLTGQISMGWHGQ